MMTVEDAYKKAVDAIVAKHPIPPPFYVGVIAKAGDHKVIDEGTDYYAILEKVHEAAKDWAWIVVDMTDGVQVKELTRWFIALGFPADAERGRRGGPWWNRKLDAFVEYYAARLEVHIQDSARKVIKSVVAHKESPK